MEAAGGAGGCGRSLLQMVLGLSQECGEMGLDQLVLELGEGWCGAIVVHVCLWEGCVA